MNRKCIEEGFIREKIDNAVSGISIYKKIWRKYHKVRNNARTCTLIFPEHNDEFEKYTLESIEHFLEQTNFKKFILIGTSEFSKEITGLKSCIGHELITEREMQLLMDSLCFFMFQTNIFVVSPDKPDGRNASNILSYNEITKEDIIKKGVFACEKDSLKIAKLIYLKTEIKYILVTVIKDLLMYLPVRTLAELYYNRVLEKGRAVYEGLMSKYDGHYMFPAPYPGTGDVYLAAMMLEKYARSENIDKYFIPVVGRSNEKICALFGLNAVSLSKPDMDNLIKFLAFAGISDCEAKIMHHAPPNLSIGILDSMRNVKGIDFLSMYLCGVFNTNDRSILSLPKFDDAPEGIDKLFDDNGLIRGKTIVLAPYNYTLPKMKTKFWEKLAELLIKKGYTVCTNCCGKKERPIKGTSPVFIPYKQIVPFLEQAGAVISVRSGLCEVISSAKCKKIILYLEGFKWNGKDNIDYFSLNNMGLCDDAIELTYRNDKTQMSLVEKISDLFD